MYLHTCYQHFVGTVLNMDWQYTTGNVISVGKWADIISLILKVKFYGR